MVSTSLNGENINLWRIFKLINQKNMRHYSTNLFKPILDYLTNERLNLQFCKESHLNSTRMRKFIEEKSNRNMLTRILVTLNNRKVKTFERPEQQRMFQEIKQIISKKIRR